MNLLAGWCNICPAVLVFAHKNVEMILQDHVLMVVFHFYMWT